MDEILDFSTYKNIREILSNAYTQAYSTVCFAMVEA